MNIKLRGNNGLYSVIDTDGKFCGQIERIQWPMPDRRGWVTSLTRWEARRPHEVLINQNFAFPTFATRGEAARYLAPEAGSNG